MARNSTFGSIIEMTLDEARLSTNSSRGVDHRNHVKTLIRNMYEMLYDEHDWPFKRIKREDAGKDIEAGSRYYDFPAALDLTRAFSLYVKWGEIWLILDYGIGTEHYSYYDSDDDERTDPPLRWQIYDENQFEIWPMPATNLPGGLRFEGTRKFTPLIDDGSRCDLDDIMIAKFVAGRILGRNKAPDAGQVLAEAQQRLMTLKARAPRPRVIMGAGGVRAAPRYRLIGGRFAEVT